MLHEIKLAFGCQGCGYNKCADALDFDHVRGEKAYNPASMMSMPAAKVLRELDKCEVVCANCHRIRTRAKRQSKTV